MGRVRVRSAVERKIGYFYDRIRHNDGVRIEWEYVRYVLPGSIFVSRADVRLENVYDW